MEASNPVIQEIYVVEYHVIIGEGFGERINDSFQFEGPLPSREAILQTITTRNPDMDWSSPRKVTYTVSRLMNNNTHITVEQGAFNPDEFGGPTSTSTDQPSATM